MSSPSLPTPALQRCPVCGGTSFDSSAILLADLIVEWQLTPDEVRYVEIQQGFHCIACSSNLRSMTLARAILESQNSSALLSDWAGSTTAALLEINTAGSLTPFLSRVRKYTFVSYPEVDMHALPFPDASFDMVTHSDTLEHVANPVHGLAECRRVLKPGGVLAYTVPAIVGRMSRSRAGLPPSYHDGGSSDRGSDMLVHTEFGADFWTFPMEAGFGTVSLISFVFPASVALACRR